MELVKLNKFTYVNLLINRKDKLRAIFMCNQYIKKYEDGYEIIVKPNLFAKIIGLVWILLIIPLGFILNFLVLLWETRIIYLRFFYLKENFQEFMDNFKYRNCIKKTEKVDDKYIKELLKIKNLEGDKE